MTFKERVFKVVSQIPKGQTLTYKEVAQKAGSPKAYRAVGNVLNTNRDTKNVPCHRVIRSDGEIGGYYWGVESKRKKLKEELVYE